MKKAGRINRSHDSSNSATVSLLRVMASFFVLAAFCASPVVLQAASAGSSTANFLKIGIGARGAAMGEAQSAISNDVTASYWNPAGLAPLRYQEISLMHYALVEGIRYEQASFALPTVKNGTFAMGLSLMNSFLRNPIC